MGDTIDQRACELAVYMIETGSTVRSTAQKFGISKSTVHKDLTEKLKDIDEILFDEIADILDYNKKSAILEADKRLKKNMKN